MFGIIITVKKEALANQTLSSFCCMMDGFCIYNPLNFDKIPTPLAEMQPQLITDECVLAAVDIYFDDDVNQKYNL